MINTFTTRRWIISLIVVAMASMAPPAGKALAKPPAWAITEEYTIDGAKVGAMSSCENGALWLHFELAATTTAPRIITVNLSYSGHFQESRWQQITPIIIGNDPIRSGQWRPAYAGQWARIAMSGLAPCDTTIGHLTTFTARRYMVRVHH